MSDHFTLESVELIAPEDIEDTNFTFTLRGYDANEVKAYLARIAAAYRTALQDAQMADLRHEELQRAHSDIGNVMQQAQTEIEQARAIREEAAADRLAAEEIRDLAIRHREETESALLEQQAELQALRSMGSQASATDPYSHAALQVAAILRAADETANALRSESDDILEAARLESEKTIADAQAARSMIETQAREFAEEQQALANAATRRYEAVVGAMQVLQVQVQDAVTAALGGLPASVVIDESPSRFNRAS